MWASFLLSGIATPSKSAANAERAGGLLTAIENLLAEAREVDS